MSNLATECGIIVDLEKIKRFNSIEARCFEDMAKELGLTVEQLGTVARRVLLDVVTQRQLVEFVRSA